MAALGAEAGSKEQQERIKKKIDIEGDLESSLRRLNERGIQTGVSWIIGYPNETPESMRATLVRNLNITPRWVENRSWDTFENARFSARLLHADHVSRIILVTTGTHEWRAVHEFMAAGLEVVPAPVGTWTPGGSLEVTSFVPDVGALVHSHQAIYELIGEPVRELFAALHLRRQEQP